MAKKHKKHPEKDGWPETQQASATTKSTENMHIQK